jgi:O-antigen/teichoic acid export membrane protein
MDMRLRKRILEAGVWTLGAYGVELFARLASNLILARLLFPEAFGLVTASSSIIVGLMLFSDFGIRAVVIQSPRGEDVEFLWSAWVFQILRATALWVVLLVICIIISLPFVRNLLPPGSAFTNPLLPVLTAALGIGLVLSGFESTALLLNQRQLNLRPLVIVDLTAKLITLPVTVALAAAYRSVWALVAGGLLVGALRLLLSHTSVAGPRMRWNWNRDHFDEIIHFGKWITVSSIATFFASQSDVLLLGVLLPGTGLGVYSIAKALIGNAEGLLERLNSSLTLSVLGEVIRVNPSALKDRYYRFRLPIEAAAAAGGGLVFAAAPQIIGLLYDARYSEAGPMLQLLAIGFALYPFQLIRSAFTAVGETWTVAFVSIVQAFSLCLFLMVGYLGWGVLGGVAGIAFSRAVPSAVFLALAHRRDWIGIWHELRSVPLFGVGFAMGKMLLVAGSSLAPESMHRFFT